MARLCERPGCSRVAEYLYAIDAEHLTVWLEPFESAGSDRAGVLCGRHADAMVVPLGWMLDDRRDETPRLFRASGLPTASVAGRPRRPRAASAGIGAEPQQLSLDAPAHDAAAAEDPVLGQDPVLAEEPVLGDEPVLGEEPVLVDEPVLAEEPVLGDEPVTTVEDSVPAADPTTELPWRPVFDQTDDLGGLLTARSPLLRRAFRTDTPPS